MRLYERNGKNAVGTDARVFYTLVQREVIRLAESSRKLRIKATLQRSRRETKPVNQVRIALDQEEWIKGALRTELIDGVLQTSPPRGT